MSRPSAIAIAVALAIAVGALGVALSIEPPKDRCVEALAEHAVLVSRGERTPDLIRAPAQVKLCALTWLSEGGDGGPP